MLLTLGMVMNVASLHCISHCHPVFVEVPSVPYGITNHAFQAANCFLTANGFRLILQPQNTMVVCMLLFVLESQDDQDHSVAFSSTYGTCSSILLSLCFQLLLKNAGKTKQPTTWQFAQPNTVLYGKLLMSASNIAHWWFHTLPGTSSISFSFHVSCQLNKQSSQLTRWSSPIWWKRRDTTTSHSQDLRNYTHTRTHTKYDQEYTLVSHEAMFNYHTAHCSKPKSHVPPSLLNFSSHSLHFHAPSYTFLLCPHCIPVTLLPPNSLHDSIPPLHCRPF